MYVSITDSRRLHLTLQRSRSVAKKGKGRVGAVSTRTTHNRVLWPTNTPKKARKNMLQSKLVLLSALSMAAALATPPREVVEGAIQPGSMDASLGGGKVVPWSSQCGQDYLVATLLGPGHKGFFIDLASNDPINLSNSRALEALGYKGLCIEPNPLYHADYAKAKRSCSLVKYAISATRGTVPFAVSGFNAPWASDQKWAAGLGGIVAEGMDNAHAKKEDIVQMPTVTFDEVLRNYSVPRTISYLSLDVEGAETLVMETFPWHTHVLSLISVERPKPELRSTFQKHGYQYVCTSGDFGDELWSHSSTRFDMLSLARWPPTFCPDESGKQIPRCRSLLDPEFRCADGFGPQIEQAFAQRHKSRALRTLR